MSVSDAVKYWFVDLEWHYWEIPSWVDFDARVRWGEYAYALMNAETPDPPRPGPGPSPTTKKMPVWMMLRQPYLF